jgi:hypothetical protein
MNVDVTAELAKIVVDVMSADESIQLAAARRARMLLSNAPQSQTPPTAQLVATGVVTRFVEFLKSSNGKLQYEAAWTLTNVLADSSDSVRAVVEAGGVPLFVGLLRSPNRDLSLQAVWAVGNLLGESGELCATVCALGVLPTLIRAAG